MHLKFFYNSELAQELSVLQCGRLNRNLTTGGFGRGISASTKRPRGRHKRLPRRLIACPQHRGSHPRNRCYRKGRSDSSPCGERLLRVEAIAGENGRKLQNAVSKVVTLCECFVFAPVPLKQAATTSHPALAYFVAVRM